MKKLFQTITTALVLSFGMAGICFSQSPAPITPNRNLGTTPGFIPGTNGTALGQPNTALGQPNTALGQPNTALGQPNTALGQPNTALGQPNTALTPSGTTNAVVPSGTTNALIPQGSSLGIGQQGTGLATTPLTNGFIVNPDGTVLAIPQGGHWARGLERQILEPEPFCRPIASRILNFARQSDTSARDTWERRHPAGSGHQDRGSPQVPLSFGKVNDMRDLPKPE